MKKLLLPIFAFVIATLAISSCMFNVLEPEGEYISKSYDVEPFKNVSVSSGMELILTQDSTISVKVATYENIHEYINVEVVDSTLKFTKDLEVSFRNPDIKIYVNAAYLEEIKASSGSELNMNSGWRADELEIEMSSGSSGEGMLDVKDLSLLMSSGSDAKFTGKADEFSIESSSGSNFKGFDLEAVNVETDLSSGSYAEVFVTGFLKARASSGATVKYKGTNQLEVKTSSGASVNKVE